MKQKIIAFILAGALAFTTAACQTSGNNASSSQFVSQSGTTGVTVETSIGEEETSASTSAVQPEEKPDTDRAGNTIDIPDTVERIVSLVGSTTEILVDLGLGDKIVAIDTNSVSFAGLPADLPAIDLMSPDIEALLAVDADLIFVSNITDAGGETSVLQPLIDEGVTVAYIPTSESFSEIMEDIRFIGAATSSSKEAAELIETFQSGIDELASIAATIPEEERRTVFFEISALPYLYSTGANTYLNEAISLVAAINVLADQESWIPVTEEAAIALNPDVILTNVNYIEDPAGEILGRPGWDNVTAIMNGDVYQIDNNRSSLPNHNILEAAWEIARAVYPEYYE